MALTDNILAYWKLDANGSAVSLTDSSGNGNALTNNGGVALGTGKIEGCGVFDETNDLYTPFSALTSDYSVSIWVNSNDVDSQQTFLSSESLNFYFSGGGIWLNDWQSLSGIDGVGTFPVDTWVNFCIIKSGGTVYLYANGFLLAQTNQNIYFDTFVNLGAGYGQYYFNGSIDEVGIWNRALTPNEVYNLYYRNEGNSYPFSKPVIEPQLTDNILAYWKLDNDGSDEVSLADSTGNSNTLTDVDGVTLGTGKINGASSFNGDSWLTRTFPTSYSTFSVSFWFKYNSYNIGNATIFGGNGAVVYNDETYFRSYLQTGDPALATADYDVWHHFVATYNGTEYRSYFDGILIETTTQSAALSTINLGSLSGGQIADGLTDEAGVWNRALSEAEVVQLYSLGIGNSYPFFPILYFNATVNGSLTTLGNWWQDSSFTIPATSLPDGTTRVFISANVTSGTGSYAEAIINSASIASGVSITANTIILNGTSSNAGTLVGSTTLNNTASNSGTITGNATIYYPSANPIGGTVSGTETYIWPNGTGLWGGEVWIDGSVSFIIPQPSDVRSGVEYGPAEDPYVGTFAGGGFRQTMLPRLLKLPFPIKL